MWKVILQNGLLQQIIVTSFISLFLSPAWLHFFMLSTAMSPISVPLNFSFSKFQKQMASPLAPLSMGINLLYHVSILPLTFMCPSPDGHIKITAGKRVFYIPNQTSNEVLKYTVNRYSNSAAEVILAHEPALCQFYFPPVFYRFFHSFYF